MIPKCAYPGTTVLDIKRCQVRPWACQSVRLSTLDEQRERESIIKASWPFVIAAIVYCWRDLHSQSKPRHKPAIDGALRRLKMDLNFLKKNGPCVPRSHPSGCGKSLIKSKCHLHYLNDLRRGFNQHVSGFDPCVFTKRLAKQNVTALLLYRCCCFFFFFFFSLFGLCLWEAEKLHLYIFIYAVGHQTAGVDVLLQRFSGNVRALCLRSCDSGRARHCDRKKVRGSIFIYA